LILNFALEYGFWKVQVNQEGLKLVGTHQLLVYADDVNLLHENIHVLNENTETLLDTSEEIP
jgi:hypothetical protein